MATNQITVFIVEDQHIVRVGLKALLKQHKNLRAIGESANGQDAVKQVVKLKPDVVLMDVGLPGLDGLEAARRIKSELPDSRIIIFTANQDDEEAFAALSSGVDGYCLKSSSLSQLPHAIQTVASGIPWIDMEIIQRVEKALQESETQLLSPKYTYQERYQPMVFLTPMQIAALNRAVEGPALARLLGHFLLDS